MCFVVCSIDDSCTSRNSVLTNCYARLGPMSSQLELAPESLKDPLSIPSHIPSNFTLGLAHMQNSQEMPAMKIQCSESSAEKNETAYTKLWLDAVWVCKARVWTKRPVFLPSRNEQHLEKQLATPLSTGTPRDTKQEN